jgi:hypothetical protein
VKLAKGLLPKKVHKSRNELIRDIVKVRNWTDARTAILFSAWQPWQYSSHSNQLKAAFLLTLEFNEDGNWKIVKKHRMSEKEIEKSNSEDCGGDTMRDATPAVQSLCNVSACSAIALARE